MCVQGVGELDQEKLGDLLQLKYHTVNDAADQLCGVPLIRDTFIGFQKYSIHMKINHSGFERLQHESSRQSSSRWLAALASKTLRRV
jgi:hypothetical protein